MSDPTRAPAGWYEDGSGARRYWDGDAWTQYVAPGSETVPPSLPVGSDQADTAVMPTGDDSPTIPFVWGSRGSDAAATTPYAPAAAAAPPEPPMPPAPSSAAPATTMLPGHPFTEPSNPGPHVVSIIALVLAIVGLVFALIPPVSGIAWILVPAAFVLSIIGLSLRGAKWPAVTGLIVSIIAAIVGIVMLVTFVIGQIGTVIGEIDDAIPDVPVLPQPGDGQPEAPDALTAGNLAFGETMTWDDGVALTVSAPEPYTPSEFAVGATQANHIVFTLTITNNSSEDLQPLPLPTLSAGDQEVSQVIDLGGDLLDPGDDVGIPPTATVEPGGSVSWRVAWSVDDPSALTLQVAPNFAYPSATFTNGP
ncbi:DUF2510 domain-containing protein [Agromyces bauzanensis]